MHRKKSNGIKVLVIDDDKRIRDILRYFLQGEGYTVIEAADGAAGLELADSTIDLVITDIVMPVKNGFEVVEELNARYPELDIIVMSGSHIGSAGLMSNGRELHIKSAMAKPIELLELLEEIRKLKP